MKKFYLFILIFSLLSLTVNAQQENTVHGFVSSCGQAGNVAFSYGQTFCNQLIAENADVVPGLQQAQLLRVEIDTAMCQNDVEPVAGFEFHSLDAEGNLIRPGQYDSAHYDYSYFNYDSLTEITLTVWPIYEVYDTLRIDYADLESSGFTPGRSDKLLSTIHDCDSLVHYMVYVCKFPEVLDGDGNNYDNLWLGYECWTGSNMRSTHYTDGGEAPSMIYSTNPYSDTEANLETYGRLYTWQSAVALPEGSTETPARVADGNHFVQGICPEGWHIPTAENVVDMSDFEANTLKSDSLWLILGSNTTGFDARPAGMYNPNMERFENLLGFTHYWCDDVVSTYTAHCCSLMYGCNDVLKDIKSKIYGLSVRCLKDNAYSDTEWTQELRKEPLESE